MSPAFCRVTGARRIAALVQPYLAWQWLGVAFGFPGKTELSVTFAACGRNLVKTLGPSSWAVPVIPLLSDLVSPSVREIAVI